MDRPEDGQLGLAGYAAHVAEDHVVGRPPSHQQVDRLVRVTLGASHLRGNGPRANCCRIAANGSPCHHAGGERAYGHSAIGPNVYCAKTS